MLFLPQSQRGTPSVSTRPAEGQHLRPGAEGRHHHQTLAGSAGQKPAGGPSDRRPGHPAGPAVKNSQETQTDLNLYSVTCGAKTEK